MFYATKMSSLTEIVRREMCKIKVAKSLEEYLSTLGFGMSFKQNDWLIYTRHNEFAAVFKNKDYVVVGENDSLSIVQQDLDVIGKVLNHNFITRQIVGNTPLGTISVLAASGGLAIYESFKNFQNLPPEMSDLMVFPLAITCSYMLANELAGRLAAKYYISKLSDKGKKYHFGYDAEAKLGKELADKGVEKSGLYLPLAISRAFGEYT